MKPLPLARFLLILLTLFAFSIPGYTQGRKVGGIEIIPSSGIDISIESAYAEIPSRGYAPLQVIIDNKSGKTRSWDFTTISTVGYGDERAVKQTTTLTVPNEERRVFDLLAPLSAPLIHTSLYQQFTIHTSGYGFRNNRFRLTTIRGHAARPKFVGMSESLAPSNLGKLQAATSDLMGSSFNLGLMPDDWRAFSGFDQIWVTDDEWRSTDAATRLALLDWVATGGILYICREENDTTPLTGLNDLAENQPLLRGFGEVRSHPRDGKTLDETSTTQAFEFHTSSIQDLTKTEYSASDWSLLGNLNELALRKTLVIGFLILFGIVIGPVNLFVFARGTKRYRLFWTTPALSFGASALIVGLILLQDGVGGQGHQLAVWKYFPDDNKTVFLQEQASRTGLLINRNFAIDVPVLLATMKIDTLHSSESGSFEVRQKAYSGDWFRSRSLQGHLLTGVTSTRSRIEITEASGETPSLLSTFPFPFESIFYLDDEGRWWRAENLRSGESQSLEETDLSELDVVRRAFSSKGSRIMTNEIFRAPPEPGHFFAFANDAGGTWETLSSIDWKTHGSFHTGPAVSSNR